MENVFLHRGDTVVKALVRNPGETTTEEMNIPGIDWDTGYPLTDPGWSGGPYTLAQNYVPPTNKEEVVQPEQPEAEEKIVENDDYVTIDGKKYSKTELRSLLE